MSGKSINFHGKKIEKRDSYEKNKKLFNTDDIDVNKILVSKRNHTAQRKNLNTL